MLHGSDDDRQMSDIGAGLVPGALCLTERTHREGRCEQHRRSANKTNVQDIVDIHWER